MHAAERILADAVSELLDEHERAEAWRELQSSRTELRELPGGLVWADAGAPGRYPDIGLMRAYVARLKAEDWASTRRVPSFADVVMDFFGDFREFHNELSESLSAYARLTVAIVTIVVWVLTSVSIFWRLIASMFLR